jgi:DNA-binding IclR family transcriptional regulator
MQGNPRIIDGNRFRILGIIMRPWPRPSIRKICKEVGLSNNGVYQHVCALEKKGLVTWTRGENGTLRPTCKVVKV